MKDVYSNLCVFNYGKHSYVVMKSSDKVMYFETVNGKYVMPITNFSLYDNEGKSLTLVNQHFFMNQLINRLNIALKKGYFSNEQDIIKYLNDLKNDSESDVNLSKLFKGSLMGEINEDNFENNKKELLKYLDKYRFDTFKSYNNVSIFDGSLEKGNVQNVDEKVDVTVTENEPVDVVDFGDSEGSNQFDFNNVKTSDSNEFIDSSDYFSSLDSNVSQTPLNNDIPGINSTDYFSDLNVTNTSNNVDNDNLDNTIVVQNDNLDNTIVVQNGAFNKFSVNEPIKVENTVPVTSVDVSVQEPVNVSAQEPVNNVPVQESVSVSESVNNTEVLNNNVENSGIISNQSSDSLSMSNTLNNSNVSYIDQVKDRMNTGYSKPSVSEVSPVSESASESFGFSSSGIVAGDSVISDNSELPELEEISSGPVENEVDDKKDKKGHLGIIIFMILLVLALGALSFYLYNYVF